jgi:Skp family chaperone for outer membrane proteins
MSKAFQGKIALYAASHSLHNADRNSSSIQPAVVRMDIYYGLVMDDPQKARSADVKSLLLPAAILVTLALSATHVAAQQPNAAGANASRFGIAVLDVSYVFKNHKQFIAAMEGLKKEMQSAEGQLKAEREMVQTKDEQRKTFKPGTPEYKQLDEEIARLKSDFNLKAGKIRKEFLEREAKVYYQTYITVNQVVQYYAQQHNIGLVLRFNGDPIDPNRREDVLRSINKPVVVQNNIDITGDILVLLDRGGAGSAPREANRNRQPAR